MISVDEARARVLEQAAPLQPQAIPLEKALGLILASPVPSDIDSPPHDKSLVDGYAVRTADCDASPRELRVLEEVTAGQVPTQTLVAGTCTRIMTGAPLPEEADAVVMIEEAELLKDRVEPVVRLATTGLKVGQHILRRGTAIQRGEIVLPAGHRIRGGDLGLLAEVGAARLQVHPPARVAILSTGNELVDYREFPDAGQIRNSNGVMLEALVRQAGATPISLGIGCDRRDALTELVDRGLQEDVLVLSGGVSAGVLDLVPSVLDESGVRCVFHKISLRPGKPLWFGVKDGLGTPKLVFGLPGNPVSSLVCFELFVRPALQVLAGHGETYPSEHEATLASPFSHRGPRPSFVPARLSETADGWQVWPLAWKGSADLRTLADANVFACFPGGDRQYSAGERVSVVKMLH